MVHPLLLAKNLVTNLVTNLLATTPQMLASPPLLL
jgi:hypothetical protein